MFVSFCSPSVPRGFLRGLSAGVLGLLASCGREPGAPAPPGAGLPSMAIVEDQPLTARIAGTAGLYTAVSAQDTGIDFVHQWKPRDDYEAGLIKTGFSGGGVAMGDYDNDGLCDLILTRPHGGARLYRNTGGFRFADATDKAGLTDSISWTTGAVFVDVDNDGRLDLFVCCYASANRLYLNRGDGTFAKSAAAVGIDHAGASVKMAFADFDRDGDLDAYLLTNRLEPRTEPKIKYVGTPGNYSVAWESRELAAVINVPGGGQKFTKAGQMDRLYRNELKETGTLRFTDVSPAVGIEAMWHGLDVTWWDPEGDGWPDLYVANDFTDPDHFYRNDHAGKFTDDSRSALPHTPWFTMGSATGDLNGDGRFDLIATDMAATTHFREKIAMGDMDALAWFLDTTEPRQVMRNAVFLNTGTNRFMEAAFLTGLAKSDWTWSVKVADLDCDGREDVYITNGFSRDYMDSDFADSLRKRGVAPVGRTWEQAPQLKERNLAFRNAGGLHFDDVSAAWGLDELGISFGAAAGDLDGDGDLDLVINNFDGPPSVCRNDGSTGNILRIRLVGVRSNRQGLGAVVRAEMPTGPVVRCLHPGNGFMSADEPIVHMGFGEATEVPVLTVQWPSGTVQRLEKVRTSQLLSLTEPGEAVGPPVVKKVPPLFVRLPLLDELRHVERPWDEFVREPLLPNKLSTEGPGMAWADVDGDGDPDVFQCGAAGEPGQLFLCGTDRSFAAAPFHEAFDADRASEDTACLFLDADGDGDADLFVASGGVEHEPGDSLLEDRLYLNDGHGRFAKAPDALPPLRESGGAAAAADVDADGDPDLFIGGRVVPGAWPTSSPGRLLLNEGGRFHDATESHAPALLQAGMVTAAIFADVNGDRRPDLLLAAELGPLRLFRNDGGKLTEQTVEAGLAGRTGWWSALAAADVDGDGDIDFAAGNLGQNTKYHPSPENPSLVFLGDFGDSGRPQIIEAKSSGNDILPVRGRSCSSAAMPFIREKFGTYRAFAGASLADIYSPEKLQSSLRLEANCAESGMLINESRDGNPHFSFRPFPALAQIAPCRGMVFFDANADGSPDLFLSQNFFGPQRETGRMDGGVGLLLTGDRTGQFTPVWPDLSGIVVPGDMRACHALDLNADGLTDLVVAQNNGVPAVYLRLRQP